MADERDSEFISQYDSFAPPVEEQEPNGQARGSSAGKLLIFLIQLPSWIVAGLFGVVIYSAVTHRAVNVGPVRISTTMTGPGEVAPSAGEGASTEGSPAPTT